MDNEYLTLFCCPVLPTQHCPPQNRPASHNAASECWHSPVLPVLCTAWKWWEQLITFWSLSGETWQDAGNEEITRKPDHYAHCIFLAAPFNCAVKSHRSRWKEQTPSYLCFFKGAATEPTLCWSYKRFAGISCSVQWDCNMIFFQSWLKVRMTLSGAPANCSVPSLIVTQILSTTDECLMGFYVRYSDTQREAVGISLSCQLLHMRSLIFTLTFMDRTSIVKPCTALQFGDEKTGYSSPANFSP